MAKAPRCAVIGAANIDIGGFPAGIMAMRDSNPGRIRMSAGGVGRNIACNLARLGVEVYLVTALGGDAFADVIRADCAKAGVALDLALTFPDAGSSSYLYIADEGGDMQLAVNDMDICARLTPEALDHALNAINAMDAVVLDANLPEATLAWLADRVKPPMIADAVSAAKARRLLPILPRLRALKPNAIEAAALTGLPAATLIQAEEAARRLNAMGVHRTFITLGERGVCCAEGGQARLVPGGPVQIVNATGAGDAFTAALVWAELNGHDVASSALAGLAAASLAVESTETVNPDMTLQLILARMAHIRAELPDAALPPLS